MTIYGDAMIALEIEDVDYGEPDSMHAIYDWAVEHGAKPLEIPHPLNVFQRVLNGLEKDSRFEKRYITYPGIVRQPVRYFRLKKEYKERDSRFDCSPQSMQT